MTLRFTTKNGSLIIQTVRPGLLAYILMVMFCLNSLPPVWADGETRVVTDRAGRRVEIPMVPQRVACLFGPSYEKLLALGAVDRVAMAANVSLPWNMVVNPGLNSIPASGNYGAPDVEQMLNLKVDLVIYHPFAKQIDLMTSAGLPVVVPYDGGVRQHTLEDFLEDWYGQIRFYGQVLGPDAWKQAKAYCTWADERIRKVTRVTSQIPLSERPRVFYFCGQINGSTSTQTRHSTADWLVTAAGGTMLTHDESSYYVTVSTEEMILWDPDIIIVSTLPSIDPIVSNPRFQHIKAVKNQNVVMSPEGQFYWSHFSTESFLCILFMARLFHPDLFQNLNLPGELIDYYARFYHYNLTLTQAKQILSHLPPG